MSPASPETPFAVAALRLGADAEGWRELGFAVGTGNTVKLGGVRVELDGSLEPGRIASWSLDGDEIPETIDGLATEPSDRDPNGERPDHPNGALSIDHLVVLTPSLERTSAAFGRVGIECRRVREAGGGIRQGFFLVGKLLVEVVEGPDAVVQKPARFWGITVVVADIDRAAELLGERLGEIKDAIQPGRRIATVRREAAGGLPLALITPRG